MVSGLDIVIIVTVLVGAYLGWRMGMARAGMALAGLGVGIVLARYLGPEVAPYFERFVDEEVAYRLGFTAVTVGVFAASVVVGAVLRRFFRLIFLGWLDGAAGAAVGLVVMAAIWSVGLHFVGPTLGDDFIDSAEESAVAGPMMRGAPRLLDAASLADEYATERIWDLDLGSAISRGR